MAAKKKAVPTQKRTIKKKPNQAKVDLAPRIKAVHPVVGDWYCISFEHDWAARQTERFIERIVLWAVIDKVDEFEHVAGLNSQGLAFEIYPDEYSYVLGTDLAPDGRMWADVFKTAKPNELGPRRFSFANEESPARF